MFSRAKQQHHTVDHLEFLQSEFTHPSQPLRILKIVLELVDFHPSHLPGLYSVCMEAAEPNWRVTMPEVNSDLLGHVYAGPYAIHDPELATVAVDEQGVAGYILGTLVSRDFWEWEDARWWPALRRQYPLQHQGVQDTDEGWNSKIVRIIHNPSISPAAVAENFPAHFHIDLLPHAQGLGLGRTLIATFESRLRKQGVPGVHLDVGVDNTNAIGFYQHLGFEVLVKGIDSLFMGKKL